MLWQNILAIFENVLLRYTLVCEEPYVTQYGTKRSHWYLTRKDGSR
jgi:hypothetical protein